MTPRKRMKVPKRISPEKMKEQRLGETNPGSSSGVYCGKCGTFLPPEAISNARCRHGHDVNEDGMYEFNMLDGEIIEGWWSPPRRLWEKLGWRRKQGYKEVAK